MEGYNVNGSTYFKLRDIADTIGGFNVDFQNNTIQLSRDGYVYTQVATDDSDYVNSISEAIEAVKAYVEREGYSDPYDMYEAVAYAGYYQVYAVHSYLGSDWIEDSFIVYEDDKNNVQLVQP